jgi:hypothetical protein
METFNNNSKSAGNLNPVDLEELIEKMKMRDEKQKKIYKRFSIMMSVFVVFYFLLLVVNPDPYLTVYKRISGMCYVLAFVIGAILFRLEHQAMLKINYAEPLLQIMKNAVDRYRPFRKGFIGFLLVPVFVDLGITIGGPARYMPENMSITEKILIFQLVYWTIMFIAGLISYLVWRKRSKPYRDAVKEMIKELDSPVDQGN